ncbi:MAG: tetratricopeptide repeat protein, partial [Candidatus Cloacimonas sp.]
MHKIMLIILGLLATTFCLAQESPVMLYLQNPSLDTYQNAVQYLIEKDKEGESGIQAKLNLAYISNLESNRLLEIAQAAVDSLKPGERFALANIYLETGKYTEAINIYELLNKTTPKWSCPWRHKGEALYQTGNFTAAKKSLENAIETNKEHYDAYIWYAKTLYELKEYKQALSALETAFSLPSNSEESEFDQANPEPEITQLY